MTAKFYGFERSFLHDTTEEDSWVIDMVRASEYVKLESEVAALQEQVRSLAAENEVLRNVFGPGEAVLNFLTIALRHTTYDEIDLSDVSLAFKMSLPETPATDAALREIRAQAVEEYAATVGAVKNGAIYAAAIRSGEQL
ncbi:hypothetical protein V6L80_00765 [Erwinia persicina]|uniref:hypothetical protein n=1 Tax=Erwinia persicina TaxID=55211 RepID=UPI0030D4C061